MVQTSLVHGVVHGNKIGKVGNEIVLVAIGHVQVQDRSIWIVFIESEDLKW